ncbi:MAG: metallophosphoesterase [Myxococcales bacterium]|nr:metallophosphoesterase [Myxococcales bacterium]
MTLLHLSDIHRTRDEQVSNEELLNALQADLAAHADDGVPAPQAVVVSGDIAQAAEPREYDEAASFLRQLADYLGVPLARVIVTPGNHDVHWPTAEEAFVSRRARPPGAPDELVIERHGRFLCARSEEQYQRRLANFRAFYKQLSGEDYPSARAEQYTVHELPALGVAFAGFNSCDLNDHERNRGGIHSAAIHGAAGRLAEFDGYRVAVWHHDLNWRQRPEADALDVDSLRQLSQRTFNLGLCGHTHRTAFNDACQIEGYALPVVAAGSLCAGPRQRGESVPRAYNVIQLRGDTARVYTRVKDERHTPWRADARHRDAQGRYVHWYDVRLPRRAQTRPRHAATSTPSSPSTTSATSGAPDPAGNPFQAVGTLPEEAPSYVRRACDDELTRALDQGAPMIAIDGPYQHGKSSLLLRARAYAAGVARERACYLDLQRLRTDDLQQFYSRFFELLGRQLGARVDDWYALEEQAAARPLALLLDELGHLTAPLAQHLLPSLFRLATARPPAVRVVVSAPEPVTALLDGWRLADPKLRSGWLRVQVGPLGDDGLARLLELLPSRARALARRHAQHITRQVAGRPSAAQALCARLHDDCARDERDEALTARIMDERSYR